MNKYNFIYQMIDCNDSSSFCTTAENVEKATIAFAKQLSDNVSAADIEFINVLENDIDLGIDGVLEAEKALSKFYD